MMTTYDILYTCPVCKSEHDSGEWNETTEEYFGSHIMPIEVADPDHEYICPTCESVLDGEDLHKK